MRKQILLAFLCINLFSTLSMAQNRGSDYQTAIGVKIWNGAGLTAKHFLKENAALEGIAYFWKEGIRISGLYEFHFPLGTEPGLQWYVGPGAHIGFYGSNYGNGTYIGLDGVIGIDYKIRNAPLNFSLDWQPTIEFGDGRGFYGGWGGLGIRYTLQ